ncbi:MAG: tyrosine--tRNA ligase, partial [Legionellaceae bacterium]|nr:tyrosine--tRNA ligase [Legionellaceae bacterium]
KEIPDDLELQIVETDQALTIAQLLKKIGFVESTSAAIRLAAQGAVKLDKVQISGVDQLLVSSQEYLIQVGKRRIAKVMMRIL